MSTIPQIRWTGLETLAEVRLGELQTLRRRQEILEDRAFKLKQRDEELDAGADALVQYRQGLRAQYEAAGQKDVAATIPVDRKSAWKAVRAGGLLKTVVEADAEMYAQAKDLQGAFKWGKQFGAPYGVSGTPDIVIDDVDPWKSWKGNRMTDREAPSLVVIPWPAREASLDPVPSTEGMRREDDTRKNRGGLPAKSTGSGYVIGSTGRRVDLVDGAIAPIQPIGGI